MASGSGFYKGEKKKAKKTKQDNSFGQNITSGARVFKLPEFIKKK